MRYGVWQIALSNDRVTREYDAYMAAMIHGDPTIGLAHNLYVKVAEIEAADLEDCFDIGNIGPEDKITRLGRMNSIYVGNILEDLASGERYVVDNIGFKKVSDFG